MNSIKLPAWTNGLAAKGGSALAAPIFIIILLAMMILPLPAFVLDVFFSFNIALSVIVLLTALYTVKPLDFMAFPAVLLVSTMLRLSLNVPAVDVLDRVGGPTAVNVASALMARVNDTIAVVGFALSVARELARREGSTVFMTLLVMVVLGGVDNPDKAGAAVAQHFGNGPVVPGAPAAFVATHNGREVLDEMVEGAHGSGDYRVTSFMEGYFNGSAACLAYSRATSTGVAPVGTTRSSTPAGPWMLTAMPAHIDQLDGFFVKSQHGLLERRAITRQGEDRAVVRGVG